MKDQTVDDELIYPDWSSVADCVNQRQQAKFQAERADFTKVRRLFEARSVVPYKIRYLNLVIVVVYYA